MVGLWLLGLDVGILGLMCYSVGLFWQLCLIWVFGVVVGGLVCFLCLGLVVFSGLMFKFWFVWFVW